VCGDEPASLESTDSSVDWGKSLRKVRSVPQ
jgi:hypothetical protein